jgi:hypothetical protein
MFLGIGEYPNRVSQCGKVTIPEKKLAVSGTPIKTGSGLPKAAT